MIFLFSKVGWVAWRVCKPSMKRPFRHCAKLRGMQMSNSLVAMGGSVGCFQYPSTDGGVCSSGFVLKTFSIKQTWRSTWNALERKSPFQCNNYVAFVTNASNYTWKSDIKRPILDLGNQNLANPPISFKKNSKTTSFQVSVISLQGNVP